MPPKKQSRTASIVELWQKQQTTKNEQKTKQPDVITLAEDAPTHSFTNPKCGTPRYQQKNSKFSPNGARFSKLSPFSYNNTSGSGKVSGNINHILGGLSFNEENGKTILFPIKQHIRSYEFHLIKSCISQNTCISLPFSISTNFIVSVVFVNFLRWFAESRVVFCYSSMESAEDFIQICLENNLSDSDITLIPAYQNFKKLSEKNGKVIVTTIQCMTKVVENEPSFCNKIRCLVLHMDPGENVSKQKKIVGPLVSTGVTFRLIVSIPSLPDGSRRTSSISKRQQLITSLLLSQWEEPSGLDAMFRCDAVPIGIVSSLWKDSDLTSGITYVMKHLEEILKPLIEQFKDHYNLPSTDLMDIFHIKWDLFGDPLPTSLLKQYNIFHFFFEMYKVLVLFGPRALWLYMTDFLNDPQNNQQSEDLQLFILSDKKISRIFNKIQNEYSTFQDEKNNKEKIYASHVKYLIIRDQICQWIKTGLPTQGVILCYDFASARCVAESLIGLEHADVRLISDDPFGLSFPNVTTMSVKRTSGVFCQAKNLILILPLCLENSLSALDTFTSNGLRFVMAAERRAICLLEHEVIEHVAVLSESFEKLRSSDGRLIRAVDEAPARRSLGGREGVVDKYDFKFEPSRLKLNPDLFVVLPSKLAELKSSFPKNVKKTAGKTNSLVSKQKCTEYLTDEEREIFEKLHGSNCTPLSGLFSKRLVLGQVYPPNYFAKITFENWASCNRQSNFSFRTGLSQSLIRILRDEDCELTRKRRQYNYNTSLVNQEKIRKYRTLLDKLNIYWNKQ